MAKKRHIPWSIAEKTRILTVWGVEEEAAKKIAALIDCMTFHMLDDLVKALKYIAKGGNQKDQTEGWLDIIRKG